MALSTGTRLGPYEILEAIGAGGMGEVYRARDTRLNRTVAVKVLPAHLAARTEARERFEREARAVASLNHPHICSLYDIGRQDEIGFLVMEYLEGETLADRLRKEALQQDEALRYAGQILDALNRAHRKGIVHRDLKPANVMLTRDGAKLLDFGLAKLREAVAPPEQTVSMTLTTDGTIVGTFQYMAPEQLEGKDADARTDIFAFGTLLYEMLTGQKAFSGKSQASLISSIMTALPPPISSVQPTTPPALNRVVRQCLEKDPDERWQSAYDLSRELKWIAEGGTQAGIPPPVGEPRKSRANFVSVVLAGLLTLALAAVGAIALRRGTNAPAPLMHFQVPLPPAVAWSETGFPVVSPDGSHIAFSAIDLKQQKTLLFIKALDSTTAQALPGSYDAHGPFWSPDSRQVAYFSEGKLKKVDIAAGGPAQVLGELPRVVFYGRGSWNAKGAILFSLASAIGGPLLQVFEDGGEIKPATRLDSAREETDHGPPQFLPDGKHILLQVRSRLAENTGTYIASLDGNGRRQVLASNYNAMFAPPGYLIFVRGATLVAQRFDWQSNRLMGEAVSLAPQIWTPPLSLGALFAGFSVSTSGLVVYRAGEPQITSLVWFDRQGKRLEAVGEPAFYSNPALSPDGKRLAVGRAEPRKRKRDIWVLDLERRTSSRLTFDPADDTNPAWSPDGSRIAFSSDRKGVRDAYAKSSSGAGEEQLLAQSDSGKNVLDWSPDGRILAYNTETKVWRVTLSSEMRSAMLIGERGADEASFSPDGRWIAYRSFESGQSEVYVQPFPIGGGKWQISNSGGSEPYWRRDGKELFYMNGNVLMAVKN